MIRFSEDVCSNLEGALPCEWLEISGIGGFAPGAMNGCNTADIMAFWWQPASRRWADSFCVLDSKKL